jgi:hypothetical protein
LNEKGVSFALINWYSVTARVSADSLSRGRIVEAISPCCGIEEAHKKLADLPINFINPFRLIGIFPESYEVMEWRWDLRKLARHDCEWRAQQWISSGYDEPRAQLVRSATFERMRQDFSAGSLPWLRRLHSSHLPEPGPFSTCMHRKDAATVSYCEIQTSRNEGSMRYLAGPPCKHFPEVISTEVKLEIRQPTLVTGLDGCNE